MDRALHLVSLLVGMLAAEGLEPPSIDPWSGWRTFKNFVRVVDEIPDPGASVQIVKDGASTSLLFVRQILDPRDEQWLEPVGGAVLEFSFDHAGMDVSEFELWTFDHRDFDEFVDHVEQDPTFARLIVQEAEWSSVYWEEA